MSRIIPHSRPFIDQDDIKAVSDVLASGEIAQGVKAREFEEAIASYIGTEYGVACSSGTSALHLALLSLGVGFGDEVVIPSYVCSSPYFATVNTGAVPKIADIDSTGFNLNVESAKKQLTDKTKAIILPHMFGTPAEINELLDLGVPIIEDCAQSLGAERGGRKVGSFGTLSIFSFYATKMITTGEGGMVLTNDTKLYDKLLELRDYDKKSLSPPKYNYKMTDFQAALGLSQLKKLPHFIERRKQIAFSYDKAFANCVELPTFPLNKNPVYFRYVIEVSSRDSIQEKTRKKGVICEKPIFQPLHNSLFLSGFPNSNRADRRALSVPIYPSLTDSEVKYVAETASNIFS